MADLSSRKRVADLYHPPPPEDYTNNYKILTYTIFLVIIFIAIQLVGGKLANSIAIISDALHLISDLFGFIFSFVFLYLSRTKVNYRISFGYHRMQLIGAILNIAIIWLLILFLFYKATERIIAKSFVSNPTIMLYTSIIGMIINVVIYKIIHTGEEDSHELMSGGHDHDHQGHNHQGHQKHDHQGHNHQGHNHQGHNHQGHDNNHKGHDHEKVHNHDSSDEQPQGNPSQQFNISIKAAALHALSDLIQSVGVFLAALIIYFLGSTHGTQVTQWNAWHLVDPFSTYLFSILGIIATLPIIKNCYYLIMESTPEHINLQQFKKQFQKVSGVIDVHDIHIWDLKPGKTILIAHILAKTGMERAVLIKLTDLSRMKKIYHSTFQIEEEMHNNKDEYIKCDHNIH